MRKLLFACMLLVFLSPLVVFATNDGVKIYNGSSWVVAPFKVRSGTSWSVPSVKVFLNSAWKTWGTAPETPDYYVATNGSDTNNGTSSSTPWRTVGKVNGITLAPGTIVAFRRGDTWAESLTAKSGTLAGGRVTYTAYGLGNLPIMDSVDLSNKNYVNVSYLSFKSSTAIQAAKLWATTYVTINDCYIECSGAAGAAFDIRFGSYITAYNNTIKHTDTVGQNDAVFIHKNVNHVLMYNNTIGPASHYALSLSGSDSTDPTAAITYSVFRNNTISNTNGALVGVQSDSNYNVFEGNIISGGLSAWSNVNLPRSFKLVSRNNIIRKNVIKDNTQATGSGLAMEVYKYSTYPANKADDNRIYGNVISAIAHYPFIMDGNSDVGITIDDNRFKNNIITAGTSTISFWKTSDSFITNNYFSNNIIYKSGTTNTLSINGTAQSVATIQSSDPTHYYGNLQQDPLLSASHAPLAGSPAIDNGAFLTTITSGTGSGTIFNLADATYFFDGFGITTGDTIQIGSNTRTITNITGNTVTVSSSVSWTQNQGVSLPYNGSAPDIGAYEY